MKVLDTVDKEMEADTKHFATRVSDDELASKRKKRFVHVFSPIFNLFKHTQVWSQIEDEG